MHKSYRKFEAILNEILEDSIEDYNNVPCKINDVIVFIAAPESKRAYKLFGTAIGELGTIINITEKSVNIKIRDRITSFALPKKDFIKCCIKL
jgi:hypothetical protein